MTGIERGSILDLHKQNFSQRVISCEIGRSKTVIVNFLKDLDAYRTKNIQFKDKKTAFESE